MNKEILIKETFIVKHSLLSLFQCEHKQLKDKTDISTGPELKTFVVVSGESTVNSLLLDINSIQKKLYENKTFS